MHRRTVTSLAIGGLVLLVGADLASGRGTSPAQAPAPVGLAATPPVLTFTKPTTLAGRVPGVAAGTFVGLQADTWPYGDGYAQVRATTTAPDGSFSFSFLPSIGTRFHVVAGHASAPLLSPDVLVQVRARIGLTLARPSRRAGNRVRFFCHVSPPHDGKTVSIQREGAGGRWVTVARTKLTHDAARPTRSNYSIVLAVRRSGRYRARIGASLGNLAGHSARRRITVFGTTVKLPPRGAAAVSAGRSGSCG